jgi:N-acyl-phosphatidylethanolamine-hydrolysing phospholipase D
VGAVRQSLESDHVEAYDAAAPPALPLQKIARGANDLATLARGDRGERTAEIVMRPLPHFDDDEHAFIQADEVEFAGFATQISGKRIKATRLQIFLGELLGGGARVGRHVRESARARRISQSGNCAGSWQYAGVPCKSHHTPRGFRNNYIGSVTKGWGEFLRWQRERIRGRLPPAPTVPIPAVAADLGFILRNAEAGPAMTPAATWIGHATMLVQAGGLNVLTDPIFSMRASPVQFLGPARAQSPGLALRDLPHIDVVVISHNHYDHLDRGSILALASQEGGAPLFLVPLGLKSWLSQLKITRSVELDWWDAHVVEGVEFVLTPAQHWSGRTLLDRNRTLWGGWAATGTDLRWFFSGDTGYSRDFTDIRARFGGFDLALIAVGACLPRWFMKDQHVDLNEAVQIHLDLGARRSLGVHWGTFQLADDPLDLPIHELGGICRAKGVPEASFQLLPVGGTCQLPRGREEAK